MRILLLAQFPPPIHGLSKAVDTLYNSRLKEKYDFVKVNISNNKKIFYSIYKLLTTKCEAVYFTIAQTRGGNLRDLLLLYIIRWKKRKLIVHLHGALYRELINNLCPAWQRQLNIRLLANTDKAIVLSPSLKPIFKGIVRPENIHIVPNCIDNQYAVTDIKQKAKDIITTKRIHLLYLNQFVENKGYKIVLDVAKILSDYNFNDKIAIHLAGTYVETGTEKEIINYIEQNRLLDFVILNGPVFGEKKKELLRMCHIFALPTTYPREGQPISILEAMGNGMTIITTNHAGIPDIVGEENGLVCPKENIDSNKIAQYIINMYEDREKLAEISERNYQLVTEKYTEKIYIDTLDNVFES